MKNYNRHRFGVMPITSRRVYSDAASESALSGAGAETYEDLNSTLGSELQIRREIDKFVFWEYQNRILRRKLCK